MTPYRVLARKYRPRNFDELIGQEALVRTLRNAITSGRIAHAFMLTGVRGVGKTTTARIIARALNYTGPDGTSGPTVGPTDDCAICQAIAEDRHPDVIEMDAASRTGVDDIREIIEGVRYAPASARYKIYIIDEVHMLSKNAFNALLKTLEEPPPHVKFIFATTEIRKVPVTILSRCQRFDLRRVDAQALATHYGNICTKEDVTAEAEALELIGRAADGSVRDGLSLLDQAISLGDGTVTAEQVKNMLGFADQGQAYSLLATILKGDAASSLQQVTEMIARGLEPLTVLQDLMDGTHILTRMKVAPKDGGALTSGLSPDLQAELKTLAAENGIATLSRVWQLLLKGVTEVQYALDPRPALEMLIIRACYAADLPDPADLIRRLEEDGEVSAIGRSGNNDGPRGGATVNRSANAPVMSSVRGGAAVSPKLDARPQQTIVANSNLDTLEAIVALIEDDGSLILGGQIRQYVRPIKIDNANCRIDCALASGFPADLAGTIGKRLTELTGRRWMVMVGKNENAQPSLKEIETAQKQARLEAVSQDETVRAVLEAFPGAEIIKIQEN